MQRELQRATTDLKHLDPAPYFVSYSVYDQDGTVVVGGLGSLMNSTEFHRRTGEVTMRVGSAALDNTHQENRYSGMNSGLIPLQNDPDAAARVLWQFTHEEYRQAAQSYLNVKTAAAVRTKEEDTSPDFAEEKPQTHLDYAMPVFRLDQKEWEDRVRRYSGYFRKYPEIYSSAVMVLGQKTQVRFVSITLGADAVHRIQDEQRDPGQGDEQHLDDCASHGSPGHRRAERVALSGRGTSCI